MSAREQAVSRIREDMWTALSERNPSARYTTLDAADIEAVLGYILELEHDPVGLSALESLRHIT